MPSWSGAGKGAITGATAGAAFGPWGALAGGAAGALIGGLSGSDPAPPPQVVDVGYGGRLGREGLAFGQSEADRVQAEQRARAERYYGSGQYALQRGQQLGAGAQAAAFRGQSLAELEQYRANNLRNFGVDEAQRAGRMSDMDRNETYGALQRLRGFYESGPGPSAAEAQLRAGQDATMAQSIALARSGRGSGAGANAMRNAAFSNAAGNQQLNQQLGVLRAQENEQFQQRRLAAMGMEQNTLGNLRAQSIGQQGQNYGFAGQMGAQGLGYGQLGAQYQQIGNQAQLGFEGMGNQTNLGFAGLENQSSQFGETMRNKIFNDTTQQNMSAQIANANLAAGHAANEQRQSAADQAYVGSLLATAAPIVSGWGKGGTATNPTSDVRAKKNIEPVDMRQVFGNGGPDLRQAQGYAYDYKEPNAPGAAPGRQVGPMAQNLPPSVVQAGPDGKLKVDPTRLTLVNTAAVSELQRRTDELEALLAGGYDYGESRGGPSAPYSMVGYNQHQPQGLEAMQTSRFALPTQQVADARAANLQQQAFGGR